MLLHDKQSVRDSSNTTTSGGSLIAMRVIIGINGNFLPPMRNAISASIALSPLGGKLCSSHARLVAEESTSKWLRSASISILFLKVPSDPI